jgi:3-methylcrotonyl-CoA carboxylase alpha subunit
MPGTVVKVLVDVGQHVSQGEPLLILEAMKMEHTIDAPSDGMVTGILFAAGDLVADGDELIQLSQNDNKGVDGNA